MPWERASKSDDENPARPSAFQREGRGARCRARGEDVVDKRHIPSLDVRSSLWPNVERALHVTPALVGWQRDLTGTIPHAHESLDQWSG